MSIEEYIKEVERFFLNERGSFSFLSAKDIQTIQNWYSNNVPLDIVKNTLKKYLKTYPQRKRKKVSLFLFEKKVLEENQKVEKRKQIKESLKPKKEWKKIVKDLNLDEAVLNVPEGYVGNVDLYIERKVINQIWKKLSQEKKQELIQFAKKQIKDLNLKPEEKEEYLKEAIYSLTKEQLKKRYNI